MISLPTAETVEKIFAEC